LQNADFRFPNPQSEIPNPKFVSGV